MIHWLALVFSISAGAQESPRFAQYCNRLATPVPDAVAHSNRQISDLRDVANVANNIPNEMRASIAKNEDYEAFKARMATKNIKLNDDVHAREYATVARPKCELLAGTEAGTGITGPQAHNAPTDEQLNRRVNDSGIGVGSPGGLGETSSETSR